MPFLDDPIVRQLNSIMWQVEDRVRYEGRDQQFEIPAGFFTDFATVPRLVVWLVPRYGSYTRAAILHDWLIVSKAVPRHQADGIFRRVLRELGVSLVRRWFMWAGVRAASRMSSASFKEWLQFLLVAPLALAFVAIPAFVVQVFLLLYWVLENIGWGFERVFGSEKTPRPRGNMRA